MTMPTRLADKIEQLKTLLVNAEDFSVIMNYFLDDLVPDPAFRAKGKPLKDKTIEQRFRGVLGILQERLAIQSAGPAQMMAALWLKDFALAHGAFALGNRLGMVFYFRDLDMGLCALGALDGSMEVMFSRFSVYDGVDPSKSFHIDRSKRRH
ncbi:hypothetical protein [uncultured Thiodictyon sp.]|uniref:hypothetical protein n=1 Tax=uncultured Thiodictyon sp. TaxID=1846217 RepID=UPI0025CDB60B|nr:hypothetical protein [uncultured Thiodictyon sp.]